MPSLSVPKPSRFPLRVGAIDVGSNGIRCVAAEFQDAEHAKVILQDRAPVRLGHTVFQAGAIDRESMEAALTALKAFRRQLDALEVHQVRAVATSAVREAANQAEFLMRARREAKVKVDVIHGAEEARLVYAAVSHRIPMGKEPWMLMDLGGGSVEVSLADARGIRWSETHPMGAVRLLEEFESCKGDAKRFQTLIADTVGTLRIAGAKGRSPVGLAATGGNIEELARLAGLKDDEGKTAVLEVKLLRETVHKVAKLDTKERVEKLGLRPDRADVIVPAGLVYEQVAKLAGLDAIHVPYVGLKEGVLHDLVDGLAVHTDPKARKETQVLDASVALGHRYQFDEEHGVHVSRLALSLFDQLQPRHHLKPIDRSILQAAAVLHDIGRFVGDEKHHKHSYYLVSQADVPGLAEHEVELAAQVARYHRKKEPSAKHTPFAALTPADQRRVTQLSAILRVADALDREHRQAVQSVKVHRKGGATVLRVKGEGSLTLEQWALDAKGGLFCRVFDTTLELEAGP
ncbi:MAG: exopolyphosphatase / guanosine-5-triphosphate,3-diphosphate pyrophosphatase [Thermoplasmata archaeon]|nr:exopolyphosphatase / guanosine-5-triphosphate,3-diphosphate pyrophosphatase [Thermoplasmata archaeon]